MIKQYIFIILMLFSTTSCSAENDFDKLCGYFKELSASSDKASMNKAQKLKFINDRVLKELDDTSNAKQAWDVIVYAVPEERYEIFKSTTTEILGTDWSCKEMQELMPVTGE
ncbi:MAG: hypothetical protein OQK98_10520 [Gammaproteobacteria bacterium]|nr:hypothetical protein [Gammaproteobacteria bacterium]